MRCARKSSALFALTIIHCAAPSPSASRSTPTSLIPTLTAPVTILAADGSQINPDRHAQVEFSLINVGAICTRTGSVQPPVITIKSELLAADDLSLMTENRLALKRDLAERAMLAELATGLEVCPSFRLPMGRWSCGAAKKQMPNTSLSSGTAWRSILWCCRISPVATWSPPVTWINLLPARLCACSRLHQRQTKTCRISAISTRCAACAIPTC